MTGQVQHISLAGDLMTVRVEVWALSADQKEILLINGSGDAWRSRPLLSGVDPFWPVKKILRKHGALGSASIIHSSSWRAEDEAIMLTFFAVIDCPTPKQHWPGAHSVDPLLPEIWGPAIPHAADEAPTPRYSDVLLHAIRHLKFLVDVRAPDVENLPAVWLPHLDGLAPALAGMYGQVNGAA